MADGEAKGSKPSRKTPAPVLKPEEEEALGKMTVMSDKIRYLWDQRYSTAQIRSYLDIRYQNVRNVVTRYQEKLAEQRALERELNQQTGRN